MCAVTEILNLALRHVAVANMCGWVCPASIHQYARMDRGTFEAFVPYEYEGKVVYSFRCIACDDTHVVRLEGPDAWTYNKSFESPTTHPSILVYRGGANPTAHICH